MDYYSGCHICQCLSHLVTLREHSTVVISGNYTLTGDMFVRNVLSLAHGLRQLGLCSGQVVAIAALNSDLYLEWLLAVAYVGGIIAPLNYRWSFEEAVSALKVVDPVILVTDGICNLWVSKIQENSILHIKWHVFMSPQPDLNQTGNITTGTLKNSLVTFLSFNCSWAPECIALICFTSGTSGRPKGVKISHSAFIVQSLAKIAIVGYRNDDIYLHTSPLCHIGGLSSAMAMLMVGGCHVFLPKFEANLTLNAIEEYSVTSLITVPTIMSDLISVVRTTGRWSGKQSVKKILNGGGSLSAQVINEATKVFPMAKLISAYGMTEACSSLTFMTLYDPCFQNCDRHFHTMDELSEWGVCVGKPAPHVELRINSFGNILTRGPHVMIGYYGQNVTNIAEFFEEGWFDTGDVGKIDECGNLWIIGRVNDRIKSGGENVYPEEVEGVISQHPGVAGIVVVGIPDSRLSEVVVGCLQLKDGWEWFEDDASVSKEAPMRLSSEELRKYCKDKKLSGFKVPKYFVRWRKAFPLTASGKLRRVEVRSEILCLFRSLPSNL